MLRRNRQYWLEIAGALAAWSLGLLALTGWSCTEFPGPATRRTSRPGGCSDSTRSSGRTCTGSPASHCSSPPRRRWRSVGSSSRDGVRPTPSRLGWWCCSSCPPCCAGHPSAGCWRTSPQQRRPRSGHRGGTAVSRGRRRAARPGGAEPRHGHDAGGHRAAGGEAAIPGAGRVARGDRRAQRHHPGGRLRRHPPPRGAGARPHEEGTLDLVEARFGGRDIRTRSIAQLADEASVPLDTALQRLRAVGIEADASTTAGTLAAKHGLDPIDIVVVLALESPLRSHPAH